jgi:hypothetical protein
LSQVVTLQPSTAYSLTYTATITSGGITPQFTGGTGITGVQAISSGTYTRTIVTSSGSNAFRFNASATFAGSIDNVILRSIAGKPAIAPNDASRPIYGVMPLSGKRNLLGLSDSAPTQSVTVTAVPHTLSFSGTGSLTLSGASSAGPLVGTGVTDIVSLTFTPSAGTLTLTKSGTVTYAQLEVGTSRSAYQQVADASGYNISETGIPSCSYLYFDGVDDSLQTANIVPAVGSVQLFAGVRKLSESGIVAEFSSNVDVSAGSFALAAASSGWSFISKGTAAAAANVSSGYSAPASTTISSLSTIATDNVIVRTNSIQSATSVTDQGTGNFLTYPINIGRRNSTVLPFNGYLYSLIVRFGTELPSNAVIDTETWVSNRTST